MYSGFYSSCGELDKFETLYLFRFGKKLLVPFQGSLRDDERGETSAFRRQRSRALPEIVIISYVHRHYRIERLLNYDQETEQLIFKFETARKVGSSGLVRLKNIYLLNMAMD